MPPLPPALAQTLFPFWLQVKIQGQNKEMLAAACQMFLGKTEAEIAHIALETLEGHQRAIMAHMTVEVGWGCGRGVPADSQPSPALRAFFLCCVVPGDLQGQAEVLRAGLQSSLL